MKNYVYTLLNMTPLGALALIVGSIDFVFTQPSSPPVAPAAPILWGYLFLDTAIIFGYGVYKLRKQP